ncbi:hypothetical protein B0H13DRAFT_2321993 [Mycena leptocephala]|nr:hypothetical protein B0H13DRAFT_2321993 [Mycena leptocephala]
MLSTYSDCVCAQSPLPKHHAYSITGEGGHATANRRQRSSVWMVVTKNGGKVQVFVVEASGVEAIRNNQKVAHLATKHSPSAVGTSGALVAVGGEDQKIRPHEWSGTTLKEITVLEGNKGVVAALGFSPDGTLLAAGDSSGRIALFDVREKKIITTRCADDRPPQHACASGRAA